MDLSDIRIAVRYAFLARVFALALASVPGTPACWAAQDLPESAQAQLLINRAEEVFHVHPETARQNGAPVLERVVADYPGTRQASLAFAYLSYGYHALGDLESAAKYQDQLAEVFPGSMALGELHLLRGEAWFSAGDKERARQCYARAVEILNQHLDKQDGRLMRWFAADKLAALYDDHESNPQQAVSVLRDSAYALRGTAQEVSAWREILRIVEAHEGETPALTPSLAQVSEDDLSGLDPDSRAAAMVALAQNHISIAQYTAAAAILGRVGGTYPNSAHAPAALLASADLAQDLDPQHPEEPSRFWREAIERYPRDERVSEAHFALARQSIAEGATGEAMAHWQAVRGTAAFVPAARGLACLELGDAYRTQGDDAQAARCYQDARILGAGTDPAWEAVRKLEAMGITP